MTKSNINEHIALKLKSLPKDPGIYLMKDSEGTIIYVGKAKNLKNRISSYFHSPKHQSFKTVKMVEQINDFEVIIVHSELDALLLERTSIKHHRPKYNVLFRDDKEYPYVKVNFNDPWPRIRKVRRRKNDKASYYGPYGNAAYLNITLQLIHRIFPLIKCSEYEFQNAKRPCNYYHMKMCIGSCCYEFERESYLKILHNALDFLQGKNKLLLANIKSQMTEAADHERFEEAAILRDQIFAIEGIAEKQTIIINNVHEADIIGFASHQDHISIHILRIRETTLVSKDNFVLRAPIQEKEEALFEFLMQYYENKFLPKEICLPFCIPDTDTLAAALTKQNEGEEKIHIREPKSGDKRKLVEMADKNALYSLKEEVRQHKSKSVGLSILQKKLNLPKLPKRIECIDISNIQGTAIVASCVCFIDGKPAKEFYRLFNIADQADNPDDFGSINKVMTRRLNRAQKELDLPELFVIDGGKGQLKAALDAAKKFPDLHPQIVSLAKSRLKSFNKNQPTYSDERVFTPGNDRSIPLLEGSPEYRILTHIRDEAHRFAISHHRKRRSKVLHGSILDEIPGIGPKLKMKLFEIFTDIEGMRKASLNEFENIKGLRKASALILYTALHKDFENTQ